MSRFFSKKHAALEPYVPGEQPQDKKYVKLNTNESPFPPSIKAQIAAAHAAEGLNLYSDPECKVLVDAMAARMGVKRENLLFNNGSDEGLNFAFMAFCDEENPAYFADITYGFYPVFAQINHIPYKEIPLKEDLTICVEDYLGLDGTIFIANPNAPTGIALPLEDIERILQANKDHIVVVDEAYVDFGAKSAVSLIDKYDNLLVVQTFSKSRSMAGARLGFCIAQEAIINDLQTIRYSTNPYNINSMTMAAGTAAILDQAYADANAKVIMENRAATAEALKELGFELTDSSTNFLFAKHSIVSGETLYLELKKKGVLIRHFSKVRIKEYNRITIGTMDQMNFFLEKVKEILEEQA